MLDFVSAFGGNVNFDDIPKLVVSVEKAVVESVTMHPQRMGGVTESELNRRAKWCINTSLMLLRERRWSIERVCDNIGDALLHFLEHGEWIPSNRNSWFGPGE